MNHRRLTLVVFALLSGSAALAQTSSPTGLVNGMEAIAFSAQSTNGEKITVPGGYPNKLILLDFWATWCGPCRAEMPNLVQVYHEFHSKGFEIIGISLDSEKSLPGLTSFLQEHRMCWPQIADGQGWNAALAKTYGVRSIPTAWLIDGTTGQIVATKNQLRGAALRGTVEQCLKNLGKKIPLPPPLPDQPIEGAPKASPEPSLPDPAQGKAEQLAGEGKLMKADDFAAQLASPRPGPIDLPSANTLELRSREVAKRAQSAHLRVGWLYRCTRCDKWHLKTAGGYAIAKDTVATAYHVLEQPANMRNGDGHPIILRQTEAIAVTSVLAADKEMDAVILRAGTDDLIPLPLAPEPQVGDPAFCLSDPSGAPGYFTAGIVNRHYSLKPAENQTPRYQRMNVSTDWSLGSSGSALLDEFGNAIGHVARIRTLSKPTASVAPANGGISPTTKETLMILHEAVPAASILSLIQPKE